MLCLELVSQSQFIFILQRACASKDAAVAAPGSPGRCTRARPHAVAAQSLDAERRGQRVGLALLEPHLQQVLHAQHVEVRF